MKTNDWIENVVFGNKFEKQVGDRIRELFHSIQAKSISYDTNPELQRIGIDIEFIKTITSVDVKVRSRLLHNYYNVDIGIEEITGIYEKDFKNNNNIGSPGWFYKIKQSMKNTKHIPVVAYCWESESGKQLEPIGYLLIFSDKLLDWYEEKKKLYTNFKPAKSIDSQTGNVWYTWNRYIPIDCFPKGTVQKFNPKICLTDFSKQTKLGGK